MVKYGKTGEKEKQTLYSGYKNIACKAETSK